MSGTLTIYGLPVEVPPTRAGSHWRICHGGQLAAPTDLSSRSPLPAQTHCTECPGRIGVLGYSQRYGKRRPRVQNGNSELDCGYGAAVAMDSGAVDRDGLGGAT